jgi:hypothetical protein
MVQLPDQPPLNMRDKWLLHALVAALLALFKIKVDCDTRT